MDRRCSYSVTASSSCSSTTPCSACRYIALKWCSSPVVFFFAQFLYAVLGMQLFGKVTRGEYLNADSNFCSFGTAFLTMLRSQLHNLANQRGGPSPQEKAEPRLRRCGCS